MKKLITLLAFGLLSFTTDENKHCYIKVTTDFKTLNDGYKKDCNVLVVVADTAGNYFVSLNAVNEFPELFESKSTLTLYWLQAEAFPSGTIEN